MVGARVISDSLVEMGEIRQLSDYYASVVAAEIGLIEGRLSVVDA